MIIAPILFSLFVALNRITIGCIFMSITCVIFYRCLFSSIAIALIPSKNTKIYLWDFKIWARALLQSGAMFCTYSGYTQLSAINANIIGQAGPIISTLISCMIGESKFTAGIFLRACVGYSGIVIIYGCESISSIWGVCMIIMANVLTTFILIISKYMPYNPGSIELSSSIIHTIIFFIVSFLSDTLFEITFESFFKILLLSLFGSLARIIQLIGIRKIGVANFAVFEYLQVIMIIGISYLMFGVALKSLTSVIGIILVLLSVIKK